MPQLRPTKQSWFARVRSAAVESIFQKWPEAKPWVALTKDWFREEAAGMRKGWKLFLIVAIPALGLIFFGEHKVEKSVFASRLDKTNASFAASNSFLLGQVDAKQKDNTELDKKLDKANARFQEFKQDVYETNRMKDAEIAKLTAERNSQAQKIAQLEALPETARSMYMSASNFYSNATTCLAISNMVFPPLNYESTAQSLRTMR